MYDAIKLHSYKKNTHVLCSSTTKKVEALLRLNVEKQALHQQAFEMLRAEYKLAKVTHKLETFLWLGWNELVEELEKQKIKLTLTQKDELNTWFRSKQKLALSLNEAIKTLNAEINACVYRLYNLTESEIRLIQKDVAA